MDPCHLSPLVSTILHNSRPVFLMASIPLNSRTRGEDGSRDRNSSAPTTDQGQLLKLFHCKYFCSEEFFKDYNITGYSDQNSCVTSVLDKIWLLANHSWIIEHLSNLSLLSNCPYHGESFLELKKYRRLECGSVLRVEASRHQPLHAELSSNSSSSYTRSFVRGSRIRLMFIRTISTESPTKDIADYKVR